MDKFTRGNLVWTMSPHNQSEPELALVVAMESENSIYTYHFGYGHTVYLIPEHTYASREDAFQGARIQREAYEAEEERKFQVIFQDIMDKYVYNQTPAKV